MRRIAISDIHGCSQTFLALLDQIALTTSDELYLLGDYVDRGPDSKGVLDTILGLQAEGYKLHCLMGNHDEAMLKARYDGNIFSGWLKDWGGVQTLDSFGAYHLFEIPGKYWDFLKNLNLLLEVEGYILVHAGLNFRLADPSSEKESLLFIRDWHGSIRHDWLGNRIIVHGHTPVTVERTGEFLQQLDTQKVIDIDTGCFAGDLLPGLGHLTAFDLTNRRLYHQKNLDDVSGYWNRKKI